MTGVEFFLVGLPGLEDLLIDELSAWYPHLAPTAGHGGVSVTTSLAEGLGFNRTLKIPTRVLVRVDRFRCRDFPKLFNHVRDLEWSKWIGLDARVKVHAATRASRVKIKTRIEETCTKAWNAARKKRKLGEAEHEVDLFVRFQDDECTLSLDTSGERLHKRGVRQFVGEAPLRETIAAALVRLVAKHAKTPAAEIVDPMAGSGTFLIEAATAHGLSDRRRFNRFTVEPLVPAANQAPFATKFVGLERDRPTRRAAEENAKGIAGVTLLSDDLFEAKPLPVVEGPRWLLVNPPYGERLAVEGPREGFYARLFAAAETWARPDLALALLPTAGAKGKLALPPGWRVIEKRPFSNGGIPVVAFVFGRRK